jgi:hypothetical protein
MVLYCIDCKEVIRSPRYKYLYINNKKTDVIVCVECHMLHYFLKPEQFKINNSKIYKDAYHKLHNGAGA